MTCGTLFLNKTSVKRMMTMKKPYFAHSSECASKSVIASRRPQRRVVEKQRFARDAQTASPPMSQQPPRLSLFVILRVWWSVTKKDWISVRWNFSLESKDRKILFGIFNYLSVFKIRITKFFSVMRLSMTTRCQSTNTIGSIHLCLTIEWKDTNESGSSNGKPYCAILSLF